MEGDCAWATTRRVEGVFVEELGPAGAGVRADDDDCAGTETAVAGTAGGAIAVVATGVFTTGVVTTGVVTTGVVTAGVVTTVVVTTGGGGTGSRGTVGTPGTTGGLGPSAFASGTRSAATMATTTVSNRLTCRQRASGADGCGPARAVTPTGHGSARRHDGARRG